jgi:topoisomerase IV subunit B
MRSASTTGRAYSTASIAEGVRGKPTVTRFKGLGEMSPLQLRETTMARRPAAWCSSPSRNGRADRLLDMLLAKKRAADRREWLESKGNLAEI